MIRTANQFTNKWVAFYRPKRLAKLSLFCFPYAGGGPMLFQSWAQRLPETIDVCPVQLPGRGSRLVEPSFTSIGPLVEALSEGLRPHFDRRFAFFGHSMGALISFELARLLRRERRTEPVHLFVSGCRGPQLPPTRKPIYDLPAVQFLEELRVLNGTAPEVLNNSELMQLMLPTIRSDFTVCQTYSYSPEPRLDCGITAFGGLEDPNVTPEGISAWRDQTRAEFSMQMFAGDHFFIHSVLPQLLRTIAESCAR